MSKDGLELFFDMDKLKDIPVRPSLEWDRNSLGEQMSYDEVEGPSQGAMPLGTMEQYKTARNPTLRSRIKVQRDEHNKELEKLNEIEKLLDENPAIEKFQDLISRTRL